MTTDHTSHVADAGGHDGPLRTEWVRHDWEDLADRLLAAVEPYRSPAGSLVQLPGPRPSASGAWSDGLEGFARTFWLAACRMEHAAPAVRDRLAIALVRGLDAGTDPRHPERWPRRGEALQVMVEAGSLAFGLWQTREYVWVALSMTVRARVAAYLLDAVAEPALTGNWVLFRVLVHAFLRSVGEDIDPQRTLEDLDHIDTCYRGNGWYSDGGGPRATTFDYYNAWSMNLYPLLWTRIEGDVDPDRVLRIRDRARHQRETLLHMIGTNGAPVYQGRSLTYRAAVVGPLWAAELAGAGSENPGQVRRAASGVMRYFVESGALRNNLPTLGWHGEFLPGVQDYSGPGSPFWLSKAFLGLLLRGDHPAWAQPESPLPVEIDDFVRIEREPGWILQGTRADGIVRLVNLGTSRPRSLRDPHSRHLRDDANYARFGYSTHTAPIVDGRTVDRAGTLEPALATAVPADSDGRAIATPLVQDGDAVIVLHGMPSVREDVVCRAIGADWLLGTSALAWPAAGPASAPDPGQLEGAQVEAPPARRIVAFSAVRGASEVRGFRLLDTSEAEAQGGCGPRVLLTGWAIGSDRPVLAHVEDRSACCSSRDGLRSEMALLLGDGAMSIRTGDATAFGRHSAFPAVELASGAARWSVISLGLVAPHPRLEGAAAPDLARPRILADDDAGVVVCWPDGARSVITVPSNLLVDPPVGAQATARAEGPRATRRSWKADDDATF